MKSRKLNFLHHLSTLVILIFLASCEPDNVVEPTIEGKYNCEETVAASGSTPASKTTFEFHVISTSADNSTYKIENFYNMCYDYSIRTADNCGEMWYEENILTILYYKYL
jgi:hypothetical protein